MGQVAAAQVGHYIIGGAVLAEGIHQVYYIAVVEHRELAGLLQEGRHAPFIVALLTLQRYDGAVLGTPGIPGGKVLFDDSGNPVFIIGQVCHAEPALRQHAYDAVAVV